jgi:hypothetical protein
MNPDPAAPNSDVALGFAEKSSETVYNLVILSRDFLDFIVLAYTEKSNRSSGYIYRIIKGIRTMPYFQTRKV